MTGVRQVLVCGAGAAGCAAAILLAEGGVTVDVAEIRPELAAVGSGITLQGNALRVLRDLGVWPACQAFGYSFNTLGLRAPDADGTLLMEIPDARTGGPDLPAALGMCRPDLARILLDRAVSAGAKVRFGVSVTGVDSGADGVLARFSDGSAGRYDLVVGADGIRSGMRELIGVDVRPQPTGMGIWRVLTPRPPSVTRTDLCYGGACYIAGYCLTGEDSLYAYLVEDSRDRSGLDQEGRAAVMAELAAGYHGPWDDIRGYLTRDRAVNYTLFESHLIDGPWHRGRVVLIGDAAHSCPPTLAQGAAQALEDAAVLADVMLRGDSVNETLWAEFTARRLDRARTVVRASVQLGQWLLDHDAAADVAGLMGRIAALVSEPA